MFDRKGQILIAAENASEEQLMDDALEAGADDIITEDIGYNEAANKLYDNYNTVTTE